MDKEEAEKHIRNSEHWKRYLILVAQDGTRIELSSHIRYDEMDLKIYQKGENGKLLFEIEITQEEFYNAIVNKYFKEVEGDLEYKQGRRIEILKHKPFTFDGKITIQICQHDQDGKLLFETETTQDRLFSFIVKYTLCSYRLTGKTYLS